MQQNQVVTGPPQLPVPPLPPGQVTVDGVAISGPQAVYQGFRAQRRELARQLESLEQQRREASEQLSVQGITPADAKGVEARIAAIDERIVATDRQIAEADAAVARAAAIPGAAVETPPPRRPGPPEEVYVLGGMFMVIVLLPLTIAHARRIWRRSAQVVMTFPKELSDRLMRVEQAVEATAIEVERIGEGQRFMTKLFTEGPESQALRLQSTLRIPQSTGDKPGA